MIDPPGAPGFAARRWPTCLRQFLTEEGSAEWGGRKEGVFRVYTDKGHMRLACFGPCPSPSVRTEPECTDRRRIREHGPNSILCVDGLNQSPTEPENGDGCRRG